MVIGITGLISKLAQLLITKVLRFKVPRQTYPKWQAILQHPVYFAPFGYKTVTINSSVADHFFLNKSNAIWSSPKPKNVCALLTILFGTHCTSKLKLVAVSSAWKECLPNLPQTPETGILRGRHSFPQPSKTTSFILNASKKLLLINFKRA